MILREKLLLEDVKKRVDELALKINASTDLLPTYGYSRDFAYPHVEIDNTSFLHYVIIERGQELERKTTDKIDELLYWIFADVTFTISTAFELDNRIEGKDSRRMIFNKQEELLGILNNSWLQKKSEAHKIILEKYPFDDFAGLRASYCGQLRKQGFSELEIKRIAYEKYPTN